MTILERSSETTIGQSLGRRIMQGPQALTLSAAIMLVLAAACVLLQHMDARLINGVSVWLKPAKFFASIAIQFATVSWAMSYLPLQEHGQRHVRWPIALMVFCGWMEMAYIVFRAARGEASHFNTGDLLGQIAYPLMGLGALCMTASAAVIGWRLWCNRSTGLWTETAGVALIAGSLLGTLSGICISAHTGHAVGGDMTDATGTGFFGWSTTGGDLRIAHFAGLHAMQIIPLAAFWGRRWLVWLAVLMWTAITAAVFVQAVLGIPLLHR